MDKLKVAAVQMCAELGAVDSNLRKAERLARDAFSRGAQWVVLPEFFTSAMAFSPRMLTAWEPVEGRALDMMRRLARQYQGVVGGSFIAREGDDTFNSFLLVFPDGRYQRHDKDLPTMWENCYYIGGTDDGVLETNVGPVGVALCWEFIRTQTVHRLKGRVGAVVGGTCWWDFPLPVPEKYRADQEYLMTLERQAPVQLARMLGVPVVHASHAGPFEALTPGNESVPYRSRYLGEAQIVDGKGDVLARMSRDDGEGVILADITIGQMEGDAWPVPPGFWACALTDGALKAWDLHNAFGRSYYQTVMRPSLVADRV